MKRLFLVSSHAGKYRSNKPLDYEGINPENGLVDELKKAWKEGDCLFIPSDPTNEQMTDRIADELKSLLVDSSLSVRRMDVCDDRDLSMLERLSAYDFIFLSGGHVPTDLAFLERIHLREKLSDFDGIVMGVSAGSMVQADVVYAQPEEAGETSPSYARWRKGLGLTNINILPHYQAVKNDWVDGLRLFEDITLPDSFGHCFIAIPDGSFVLQKESPVLYGLGYLVSDGVIKPIGGAGMKTDLSVFV